MESLPQRPPPARSPSEAVSAWLQWFGVGRLVVTALAVVGVASGAYWLLRAPAPPIEDHLPVAAVSITVGHPAPESTEVVDASTATAASETSRPDRAEVFVAGAVAVPGVYVLEAGSRVHDAVDVAGGLSADADLDAVNLAAPVSDGDRVYVPHLGQPVPTVVLPAGGSSGARTGMPAGPTAPIDLNDASAEDLDALPGIGPSTAAAIVAHREQNGPFASVEDLLAVRGIGPAKLDAIRDLVTV